MLLEKLVFLTLETCVMCNIPLADNVCWNYSNMFMLNMDGTQTTTSKQNNDRNLNEQIQLFPFLHLFSTTTILRFTRKSDAGIAWSNSMK